MGESEPRREAQLLQQRSVSGRIPGGHDDVPRWRLARCRLDSPQRTALLVARRLQRSSPPGMFISTTQCPALGHVLVAMHWTPVGTALSPVDAVPPAPGACWFNRQDQLNCRRGIRPATAWLLKEAARRACLTPLGGQLRRFQLVLLPHTGGEVMVHHPAGWRGRGIAWRQEQVQAALVWQIEGQRSGGPGW